MIEINDRISIQVGLSGYSFKIQTDSGCDYSGWKGADTVFVTPEFQKRYSDVEISVFTPYCTLVPQDFHRPESSKELLSEVVNLPDGSVVDYVPVPELASVMIYSNNIGGTLHKVLGESVLKVDGTKSRQLPELYYMLRQLSEISDYNRILASYMDGVLYLVIAQGRTLLLCNSYKAADFTTAEYFIFMAMKKLQLNPEMSSVYFRTPLDEDQQMSLYRYFMNVEHII
jgi:hypothetical protein